MARCQVVNGCKGESALDVPSSYGEGYTVLSCYLRFDVTDVNWGTIHWLHGLEPRVTAWEHLVVLTCL